MRETKGMTISPSLIREWRSKRVERNKEGCGSSILHRMSTEAEHFTKV